MVYDDNTMLTRVLLHKHKSTLVA